MASRHTANYQLNQWEAADKVVRTDFNADNAKIDAALAALAEGKADKSAVSSLSSQVSAAVAEGVRLAIGTYTGNGERSRSFNFSRTLGRPPKVMVVRTASQNKIRFFENQTSTSVTITAESAYYADNEKDCTYSYFVLG